MAMLEDREYEQMDREEDTPHSPGKIITTGTMTNRGTPQDPPDYEEQLDEAYYGLPTMPVHPSVAELQEMQRFYEQALQEVQKQQERHKEWAQQLAHENHRKEAEQQAQFQRMLENLKAQARAEENNAMSEVVCQWIQMAAHHG